MDIIKDFIEKIGFARAASIAGTILASTAFFIFLIVRTQEPEMGLLFAQMDPGDGAKILERLRSMNIPTEVRGEGNQIFVPLENIAKLRMELATDGLPAGGTIGYEIFDKTDVLGTTHALMDINFLRATEGELAKSVRTIQGVQSARVHLVIPKRELFSQEKSTPSASIILKMKGVSRLSVNQVLSIQHLVASAIPDLTLDKISIIDDKGTLLAKGQDRTEYGNDSSINQQETRQAFEGKLSRSIESLLERTLGPGRARAEISAELDFDKITSTSVEFNPDGQVARSIQNSNEGSNGNEASAADAITVQNALPDPGATAGTGSQSKNQATRTDENTSFEISNTTRTHIKESGTIKRLSIAVLIDGTYKKGADGKDAYSPRTAEEITQITDLVRTAAGFKEDRGDTVKIVNMRFNENLEPDKKLTLMTKITNTVSQPKTMDLLLLAGIGMLLFFGVIRPMVLKLAGISSGSKNASQTITAENDDIYGEEDFPNGIQRGTKQNMIDMENIEGRVNTSSIKRISEIIEKHPDEAVAIMRTWIHAE
ncbi:MAG: flagellar basal-body MS-ring/collar protein FliF [Pseudomonadota bacterium]